MGLFKGIRDVKRLSDHHGGTPSPFQAFKDLGALADDRGEHDVLEHGIPAKAVARGFPEAVQGERFVMSLPVTVHPPEGAPYDLDYVFPTARMKAAISVGMEFPIKIHPQDPSRIAVEWEGQQVAIAAAGGDYAAVTQGLANTYGDVADQAMRQAQASVASADPAAKIEKLGQMRDAGLITQEEFDAKKTELLKEF